MQIQTISKNNLIKKIPKWLFFLALVFFSWSCYSQKTSLAFSLFEEGYDFVESEKIQGHKFQKKSLTKRWIYPAGFAAGYVGGMAFLYQTWYQNEELTSFRFFDDNRQWNQLDKFGHAYTTYQLSRIAYHSSKKLDYSKKTSLWISTAGFWMMLPIEVFDGFAPAYGASYGDVVANGVGTALFLSQQLLFEKQRVHFKFSFSPSPYANLRPDILGNSFSTQIIKDYNGQTYWLSSSPFAWHKNKKNSKNVFQSLAISLGYGAEGMVYGTENQNNENGYASSRRFYLSLDIDWQIIHTQRKGLKLLFGALNAIKVPFPAFYYDTQKEFGVKALAF